MVRAQAPDEELRYTVLLTRHGVRAPTWEPDRLNRVAASSWPKWDAGPGELTPHGRLLMKFMGGFYREYLHLSDGCADAAHVYVWADTDQRTTETAKAMAEGLVPNCALPVHHVAEGADDPLFDPISAGQAHPDPKLARAAILGRVGPRLETLVEANRPAFDILNQILNGGKPKPSIMDQPVALSDGKGSVAMTGPLATASTLTENLLLEYCEGMTGERLGWGRLDAVKLRQIMALHTSYAELLRRTPYLASARGSILLSRIAASLQQSVDGKPLAGSLGSATDKLLIISGHDTNISNLSGMLRLSWLMPDYQPDDVPPGGALLFSLSRSKSDGRYWVRLQFVAQTLDQMHNSVPLSLAHPPEIADLFVPGCSTARAGFPCAWEDFRRLVKLP